MRYVFRNVTGKDVDMLVGFPLPDLDGGVIEHEPIKIPADNHPNYMDFSVTSNGRPVHVSMDERAISGKKDITAQLKAVGLSPNVFHKPLSRSLAHLSKAQRKRLEQENLLLPGLGDHDWFANWKMRVTFYWRQRFPANSTVTLVQTYRPVVGGSYIVKGDSGKYDVQPYCGTDKTLQQMAEVEKRHPAKHVGDIVFWERTINYILITANNWNGPIGRFQRLISTDFPDDILVTCMPGLRRIGTTHYELTRTRFSPSRTLKLLILHPANPRTGTGEDSK